MNYLGSKELYLFNAEDALQIPQSPNLCFRRKDKISLEVRIYGKVGYSELTGYPIIEEMEVRFGKANIVDEVPESLLQEWEADLIQESGIKDVPVTRN